jgi:hypothetical protein
MSNKIVFKSSIAKILRIVLFLKIMFLMKFDDFSSPQVFLASFRPSPKLLRYNCGPFASHRCVTAHWLKIAAATTAIWLVFFSLIILSILCGTMAYAS